MLLTKDDKYPLNHLSLEKNEKIIWEFEVILKNKKVKELGIIKAGNKEEDFFLTYEEIEKFKEDERVKLYLEFADYYTIRCSMYNNRTV